MLGVIIGLILGMIIAFVMESFDTSLGAIEDVEETLGTEVLGVIPQEHARAINQELDNKGSDLIDKAFQTQLTYLRAHFVPRSMMAESFRALRTNIQFKETEKEIKTIAITSTSPREGKTLVTVNLAITMAQARMKTLLVGSDLRKPMLGKVFEVEPTPGITEVLLGVYPWRETVKSITDIIMGGMTLEQVMTTPGLDNLYIITSGASPPNPAELIDSKRLTDFVDQAKKEYDIILFDSTPILSAADAAILGTKMDGVLLVYRIGAVSKGLLKRSAKQLAQVNCNILGVIINGMRPDVSPDFHDYKYYRYYYSYGEEERGRRGRKKGDEHPILEEAYMSIEKGKASQDGGKRPNIMRSVLLLVVLGLLSMGLLWQRGTIDPSRLFATEIGVNKNDITPAATEKLSRHANHRVTEPIGPKPKRGVVAQETRLQAMAVKRADVEKPRTAPAQKEISTTAVEENPEAVPVQSVPTPPTPALLQAAVDKSPSEKSTRVISMATPLPSAAAMEKEAVTPAPAKPTTESVTVASKPLPLPSVAAMEKEAVTPAPAKPTTESVTVASIPTAPPPAKKALAVDVSKRRPAYPYSLYLGSFRTPRLAKRAVSIYSKKGLSPYWVKMDFKEKGIWYRIYAGHFETREQAEIFRQMCELKEATIKKTTYANLIGVYSRGEALEEEMQKLVKLGYSPYVIQDRDGKNQLFVGAYLPKRRAERQHHELKSSGIESHIVMR